MRHDQGSPAAFRGPLPAWGLSIAGRMIRSMKTRVTISLDADIAERIKRLAEGEGKDVSPWLNDFVRRHTEIAELREVADQLRAAGVDSDERWERRARLAAAARAEFARTESAGGSDR